MARFIRGRRRGGAPRRRGRPTALGRARCVFPACRRPSKWPHSRPRRWPFSPQSPGLSPTAVTESPRTRRRRTSKVRLLRPYVSRTAARAHSAALLTSPHPNAPARRGLRCSRRCHRRRRPAPHMRRLSTGSQRRTSRRHPGVSSPSGHTPHHYKAQTPGPCTPAHSARPRAQATIKLFKAYDDDGNGELDFDEFKQVRGRLWFATGCGGFAGAGAGVRGTS